MDVKDVLRKYEAKLEKEIGEAGMEEESSYSREYVKFKEEVVPTLGFYEKLCRGVGKTIRVRLKKQEVEKLEKAIEAAKLEITPSDASAFAIFSFLFVLFVSILGLVGIWLAGLVKSFPFLALFLVVFISLFLYYYISTLPYRYAQKWRLKAASQMVPCILYIVVFMRQTSNLELAIRFASQHLQNPLALDFKKVFWDVETGKYSNVKDSLDAYLEKWRDYSLEFIEAFHLIEGSLYEPSNERRIETLEKALTVILDGVYEKMLHYTHDITAPLTNLYMLGIVLPTLGIALLPLASTLLQGAIKWYHVMLLFNFMIPFLVFYLTSQILAKRPGGYGETELVEQNPDYKYYKSNRPYYKAALIALPLLLIALAPLLFQYTALPSILGMQRDYPIELMGVEMNLFDFKSANGGFTGPFGLFALLLSLALPLSVALFFSTSYRLKTRRLIETRKKTKELEAEFATSIFQLGNRLADGIPAEMAFGHVAQTLKGTSTAEFFNSVNSNIQQAGMSVKEAIFNPARGAIIYFPSTLIRTSMQILIESVKKGLNVAAKALISISQYVKNIHKINERLKDLLAEVVSGMRSNMSFLAPVLAGIVVGLSAMITAILSKLGGMIAGGEEVVIPGGMAPTTFMDMFNIKFMIPPYFLQIIVGLYIVEIVYILTLTLVSVEAGADRLGEKSEIAKNMQSSIIMYTGVAILSILALTVLAGVAITGLAA